MDATQHGKRINFVLLSNSCLKYVLQLKNREGDLENLGPAFYCWLIYAYFQQESSTLKILRNHRQHRLKCGCINSSF